MADPLFFIDSLAQSKVVGKDNDTPTFESFIGLSKSSSPNTTIKSTAVDPATRQLQHTIDVRSRIYFSADPKSLVASCSKNKIAQSNIDQSSASTQLSTSIFSAGSNELVNSLLSDSSSVSRGAMAKSIITPDFNTREAVPSTHQTRKEKKKAFKEQQESSKGAKWFHMKKAEMTEEEKRDLKILKMRKALDPKTFYKGEDMKGLPRFYQKGIIVEDKSEFYSARIPKKQRSKSIAGELMADTSFLNYGSAKVEERSKFEEERKKRIRQKKHLARMTKKKGRK